MERRALAFCILFVTSTALAADKEQFTPLFDGKALDGWEGDKKIFRVDQGAIVGGNLGSPLGQNEFICTEKSYGNFELRLKCKLLGKDANAGIQIRSQRIPNNNEMIGYQADMGQTYWGCLYDESRRKKVLAGPTADVQKEIVRKQEWNDYVIRCEGPRIQLWINGRQTVDYTESDASLPQTGIIGLQIHSGPPAEAWYKDISIRELTGE